VALEYIKRLIEAARAKLAGVPSASEMAREAANSARVWRSESAMSWMTCSCLGLAQRRHQRLDRQELNRLNGPPSYPPSLRY
jgi:hypothetical protein